MGRPAVFLDRDGVLIRDVHDLVSPGQVELLAGTAAAIAQLRDAGLAVVVVSNQPIVARGLATEADVKRVNTHVAELIRASSGAEIDRFFYCPHHPRATLMAYRRDCACRKPQPGMLLEAAAELGIDLRSSALVGDRLSDIAAGRAAGCRAILVETGMHAAPPIESNAHPDVPPRPDAVCADLTAATAVILRWTADA